MNFLGDRNLKTSGNIDPEQEEAIYSETGRRPSNQQNRIYEIKDFLTTKTALILLVCFIISLLFVCLWVSQKSDVSKINSVSLREFLINSINNLEDDLPRKYVDIDLISQHSQLPFCIIIDTTDFQLSKKVGQSIKNQQYSNYKIIEFNFSKPPQNNYLQLLRIIKKNCQQKSILFFVDQILSEKSLKIQNQYFQTYNTWVLYDIYSNQNNKKQNSFIITHRTKISNKSQGVQIFSVYMRVFQLLHNNDFFGSNSQYLTNQLNPQALMTGIFELARYNSYQIQGEQVFLPNKKKGFMYGSFKQLPNQNKIERVQYENLHSLNQNFKRYDLKILDQKRYKFYVKNKILSPFLFNKLNHSQIQSAIQLQQVYYLPDNHSLNLLQIRRMEQKYQTGKYLTELPLCIHINSHNNEQNNRYEKVLESVVAQNYSNYHIVFIDDSSTDQTLNLTKTYLQQTLKFSNSNVTYVKNQKQKFATYNIVNAGFNFCRKDQIHVIVDGDDKLIGRQVFKFINAQYQANDLWVMYTFYIDDKYTEGFTHQFQPYYPKNFLGRRSYRYYFSPLRSFKTTLFRKIPLRDHLDVFGNFLDTIYDAALQHPLFQLSEGHSKSVLEPQYFYFSDYGNNDGSTFYKDYRREVIHFFLWLRSPLQKLEVLDDKQDQQIRALLEKDRDVQYTIV